MTLEEIQTLLVGQNRLSIDPAICKQLNFKVNLLHKSPPVLEIENFFTDEECNEYMAIIAIDNDSSATASYSALQVNSPKFSAEALSRRTSTTWFCHYHQVPSLLAKAKHMFTFHDSSSNNNNSNNNNKQPITVNNIEEPQIVRYRTNEEFTWHYDEIPSAQLDNGGQRIATLLVYLNTLDNGNSNDNDTCDDSGGATVFRDLKFNDYNETQLKVTPKRGNALLFFPADVDGVPDDRTLHKGEKVKKLLHINSQEKVDDDGSVNVRVSNNNNTSKVIAQIWVHEGEYQPAVPSGNCHEDAHEAVREMERRLGLV